MKVVSELPGRLCVVEFEEGERERVVRALDVLQALERIFPPSKLESFTGRPAPKITSAHPWRRHAERVRTAKKSAGSPAKDSTERKCDVCGKPLTGMDPRAKTHPGECAKKKAAQWQRESYARKHPKAKPGDAPGRITRRCARCNSKFQPDTVEQIHCAVCIKAIAEKLPGTGHGAGGPGPDVAHAMRPA